MIISTPTYFLCYLFISSFIQTLSRTVFILISYLFIFITAIFITCDGNVKRVILTNTFYIIFITPFIIHIVKLSDVIKNYLSSKLIHLHLTIPDTNHLHLYHFISIPHPFGQWAVITPLNFYFLIGQANCVCVSVIRVYQFWPIGQ